jgi:hypothetical protein
VATTNAIIFEALGKLGVVSGNDPVNGDDAAICLTVLNTLIDAYPLAPGLAITNTYAVGTLNPGVKSLSIGTGQTLNVPCPIEIEDGSFVTVLGQDYALDSITEAEYNAIVLKGTGSFVPRVFWFSRQTATTAQIFYYPTAANACVVNHPCQLQFVQFPDLTTDITLPLGYKRFMVYNLAAEVAPHFEREVPPSVLATAQNTARIVRRSNTDVPQLDAEDMHVGNILGGWR